MSYILDALKKSERERSLGKVETLDTLQSEGSVYNIRLAIFIVSIAVSLCVILAGFVWYFRAEIRSISVDSNSSQGVLNSNTELSVKLPDVDMLDSTRVLVSKVPEVIVDKQESVSGVAKTQSNGKEELESPQITPQLVDLARLPAEIRKDLPPLIISVLSYSADPVRRFVMIDDVIYKEGEPVTNNVKLLSIERDRLIFKAQNRTFFKKP